MDEDSLFPDIELDDELEDEEEETERYYPSVCFDFEKGDFVLDGANRMVEASGQEAYQQWCMKIIDTEREEFAAYSDDIGTEFEEITGDTELDRDTMESEIEDSITDALMMHPATEYVGDFSFEHEPDSCAVTFTVKGYDWEEQELTITVPV